MASPPFLVEDQTDEDFFDKLVNDDFGVSESGPSLADDGVDSLEVKAFSNLSMADGGGGGGGGTASEDSGGEEAERGSTNVITPSLDAPKKEILVSEESTSVMSSSSVDLDNGSKDIGTGTATGGPDQSSESTTTSKNSGSRTTSIKEVQWSLFNADSAQQDGNGFGSYSDLFADLGDSAVDPFAQVGNSLEVDSNHMYGVSEKGVTNAELSTSVSYAQPQNETASVASTEQVTEGQEYYNSQYWENMYPGWRYDPSTGQWIQIEGYGTAQNIQGSVDDTAQVVHNDFVSGQKSEVSYLQQNSQSVVGTVAEGCTTGSVSIWNQAQQETTQYPAHMVFDPQYPGWYYDTIAQEWRSLDSYTPSIQSASTTHSQGLQSGNDTSGGTGFFPEKEHSYYGDGQIGNYEFQGVGGQDQGGDWSHLPSNYVQPNVTMWQPETVSKNDGYSDNQQLEKHYGSSNPANNFQDGRLSYPAMGNTSLYEPTDQTVSGNGVVTGFQSFVPSSIPQQPNQPRLEQRQQPFLPDNLYGSTKSGDRSHQLFQNITPVSYNQKEERSSAGRPPHPLVTFGFGGKLIVMKDSSSFMSNSTYRSQDSVGGSISVLDVMDLVAEKSDTPVIGLGVSGYFRALCQQSFPGPLVGGSVGIKELNKWIDDRIVNCESPSMDYRNRELLRLLLSLLKIASQHYGKLRSPFGTDPSLKESDRPEAAVAKLFASAKRNGGYGALAHCLHNVPAEGQIRATAAEVQNLLVSGRTKEALQCAQEGQLWGPALILAAQLGDQFYVDTVKQMAHRQLVAGSPLRTLCLLIAGQPADVFSAESNASSGPSGLPAAVNASQHHAQIGSNGMLNDWEENLAIISANRTKGDELVILHLGDCLWKERGEIIAAHICYLVAEANFESFSDSARLCLLGADHWKFPRTYANPDAIQRTEFYEYAMVLGNSQSILLPFQPYKLIYAYMLAEVGKISDSLKYCQALLKSLKTGRAPEVDAWKQLVTSLDERIRTHQQGGFSANLAPGKLVGKLLPFLDRSIHRMIGPPPPAPSANGHELAGPRVANSQSTMAMSSLMPSDSMEPISARGGGNRSMHNRSISEPDFGRTPRQGQVDPSKEASSSDGLGKASDTGGPSRFGRIGSTLFQKTMGWVSRSKPDRQAKLGEKNKFYYDEKLKRWVEEGVEPPAEETAPPPPPTTATFQNGMSDYSIKKAFKGEYPSNGRAETKSPPPSERSSGIPPMPPSSNQFSARGRMGVRSRYVDTFNKDGGAQTNFFQSPSISAAKPAGGANAKFFIPTPTSSGEQTADATGESMQEAAATNEVPATYMSKNSFSSPQNSSSLPNSFSSPQNSFSSPPNSFSSPPNLFSSLPNSFSSPPPPSSSSSSTMQRFPSMNNISPTGTQRMGAADNGNGPLSSRSRRTASWSGTFTPEQYNNPPAVNEIKPLGEALGMPPSSFMPSDQTSPMHPSMNGGSFAEDLQEVEL